MKKKKTFKEKIKESVLVKGEFYVKISLTILFVALYLLIFFLNDGLVNFEKYNYAYGFKNISFQVHTIDVENGDAFLVRLPNKKTLMIDTGDEKYYERVSSYIRQYRYYEKLQTIDYLVLTHPDADHIGNASKIIDNFGVKTLFRPKIYSLYEKENGINEKDYNVSDSKIYNQVIQTAIKNNCEIIFSKKGINLSADGVEIEFLSPKEEKYNEDNNYSAVIMIRYEGNSILFTGDAETKVENTLIEDYGSSLKADILKIGHHGSNTSTSQEFLNFVKPKYAIISSSGTSSILPNSEIIERLNKNNVEILSTANLDSFAISFQDNEVRIDVAGKKNNYLELIFVIFIIVIFILWRIPFDELKNNIFKTQNR